MPFYEDSLGLQLEKVEEVHKEKVKIAFLKIGETRIELLEPLHNDSTVKKFIDKKGEGIHHIALEVDDINLRFTQLKEGGVQLIDKEIKLGANNTPVAFIHPKAANGVLYELCQHKEEREL